VNLVAFSWNPDIAVAEGNTFYGEPELRAFNRLAEEQGLREMAAIVGNDRIHDELDAFASKPFVANEEDDEDEDEKPKLYLPVFGGNAIARIQAPPELTVKRVRLLARSSFGEWDDKNHGPWWFAGPLLVALHPKDLPDAGFERDPRFALLLLFRRVHEGTTDWACDGHVLTTGFTVTPKAESILQTAAAWHIASIAEALTDYAGGLPWAEWGPWGDEP